MTDAQPQTRPNHVTLQELDNNSFLAGLLQARLAVGFLGERAQYAWWPTAFYETSSRFFLEPVFAKTSRLRNIVIECFAPRYLVAGGAPAAYLKRLSSTIPTADQTQLMLIFTCRANPILGDFVRHVYWARYTGGYTQITSDDARTRDDEKQFEALQALELELIELRDTLLKLAPTYKPKHDDGVQISAAPLWPLFRHKPWQNVLKDTWAKLEKGGYDWAMLAMNYWPDRVREKCKTDKSLAIAHGLEHLYVEPPPKERKLRKKKGEA